MTVVAATVRTGSGSVVDEPLPQRPPSRPVGDPEVGEPPLARICDRAVDLAVVVLATWTLVYHGCLLLRVSVPWAVSAEVGALVLGAVVVRHRRYRRSHGRPRDEPAIDTIDTTRALAQARAQTALIGTTVVAAAIAAVVVAAGWVWPVAAAGWLVAAGTGTAWAALRLRAPGRTAPARPSGRGAAWTALAWATALALLSVVTLAPNPDDLYYVNLSQWIAEHGTFPLRDTIFSDLVFPMSSWPPMASYDALTGALAYLAGVNAASVVYLVVPPLATFLSVLALSRLLRAWRVAALPVALSLALVFLLFDGGDGYAAPGTLFLTRIWQGKVILLCLLVPVLLVYALRFAARPSRANAGWLAAGGVAAVGLSTTAMFLVPLLALGGAAPLLVRRRGRAALGGFAAMAAYPLAAAAVTLAVGGRSADMFELRRLYRFDPSWFGPEILRDGLLGLVVVVAVLGGAVLVPQRDARVTTGVLVFLTGVTFVPGVTELSGDLVGLGPTLWRVSWVATIAALVGVLGARLATMPTSRPLRGLSAAALALVIAFAGVPIWSAANGVDLELRPHWQHGPESVRTAELLIDHARPGDLVLAPDDLSITVDVLTTRVKTVAPRAYFMDYLRDDPRFHFPARLALVTFADELPVRGYAARVARALDVLDVDHVCLPREAEQQLDFVVSQGYQRSVGTPWYACASR